MPGNRRQISARSVATASGFGLLGALVLGITAAAAAAVIFARAVVTPPKRRDNDERIVAVGEDTITLAPTIDALTPGRYSLWFSQDAGHARVGEIIAANESTVTRELIAVDYGAIATASRARFGGWFFLGPRDLGVDYSDVAVSTELGPAPAWLIPAAEPTTRWVIGVHGRAVRRQEALRAVPVFREAGYTSLLISYRNDGDAPQSADYRYALGDTEWNDVDAAMRFAVANGATSIVLMGWSMGGATVLQALTRSGLREKVTGVVLESPVVDWITALRFQGVANRLPRPLQWGVLELLSRRWAGHLTGQSAPIDLDRLDFVRRAGELHTPILLLHSADDGYIPPTASEELAAARPDIVTFVEFSTARHTRLWNYDAPRWNAAIATWLAALPVSGAR